MLADSEPRCVADVHAVLGEGPVWVARERALYWVDVKGLKVFRLGDRGELQQWRTPFRVGSVAPRVAGGFIAGTEHGIAEFDPASGRLEIIFDPEESLPTNRFNDGKVDRRGRFWAGTMDDEEVAESGTLYVIDEAMKVSAVDSGYKVTNGPAFSPAGDVMYHNDSAKAVTYAFDIAPDGRASNRRIFLEFRNDEGSPDGMTVDSEGCLWIAFWDGWSVRRYSPAGQWLETVKMPVQRPTSCAFGGPDLDRLYVTSASFGLDESSLRVQPNAGGLFMLEPGVNGISDAPFAG